MQRLLDGVSRFQREVFPRQKHLFEELAEHQNPEALFITCADSRVVPDLM
jgi:carbonic anhydrase